VTIFLLKYVSYWVNSQRIKKIQEDISENYIWISVDETTDVKGRYIANMIVGKLTQEEAGNSHLLASKELEKTNHKTIVNFVDDSLSKSVKFNLFFFYFKCPVSLGILYAEGVKKDKVLLFLSDAAPYMKKAGEVLQIFYQNMIHVTCLAHGLHRICETIREEFPAVNKLISSTKKVEIKT
jgi:hypothetical protein